MKQRPSTHTQKNSIPPASSHRKSTEEKEPAKKNTASKGHRKFAARPHLAGAEPQHNKRANRTPHGSQKSFKADKGGVEEGTRQASDWQRKEGTNKKNATKKPGFRKFEEADLSFGRKKRTEPLEKLPKRAEVTFSKSIEKWETPEVKPTYGAAGKRTPFKKEKSKFQRQFDNGEEKAYSGSKNLHEKLGPNPRAKENYYAHNHTEGEMPLNKFIAHCDVCSRRDAVPLIKAGKVKVNGTLILEPGFKVTASDQVTLSGKKLHVRTNLVYILLNKPKGYITTTDDPKGRRTVMDLFENQVEQRIFPVGRLDRNTTGLLLLTNDGELTQHLAHPKYEIRKVYQVTLDKKLHPEDFKKIQQGVMLDDGPAPVDQIAFLNDDREIGLEIHNGKNRIVRRIFESLGYEVEKLDRVLYAGLTKKNLPRGKWRFLTKQEVINLKHLKK